MRKISIISIVTVILAFTGFGCRNYSTEELVKRRAKKELRDIASDIRHVSEPVLYKKVSPKFIIEHQTSSLNRAFDRLNRVFDEFDRALDSLDYYVQKKIYYFKEFNYNEYKFNYNEYKIDLDSLWREYDSIQSFLSKYSHDYIVYKVGYETKESVKDTIFVKYCEYLKEDRKQIHLSASREDDDYDTLKSKSIYTLFLENDSIKDIILKKKEQLVENKKAILMLLKSLDEKIINEKIINKIEIDTFRLQMEAFKLWLSERDSIKISSTKD